MYSIQSKTLSNLINIRAPPGFHSVFVEQAEKKFFTKFIEILSQGA